MTGANDKKCVRPVLFLTHQIPDLLRDLIDLTARSSVLRSKIKHIDKFIFLKLLQIANCPCYSRYR